MKKAKKNELPAHTLELFARCLAVLKPPPALTLSQWADMYRVLSAESSAEPGRWHTDKAPYQREIMDAIGDPHIRKVVIMSAAQIGKTDILLNALGYYMDYMPAPVLVIQPSLDMGQTFSKDRLAPMLRDTPALQGKVDTKSRYSGNTIMKKNFPGGHITIVGANSPIGLASRPIKVLLADEVDRYPSSAGTEGDPLLLAQKRQTTFWDKKTIEVSTPGNKIDSRIAVEYENSTREEWNIPCPGCGHYQPLIWKNVIFDKQEPEKPILYKCERCGNLYGEYQWKAQSKMGRFVADNPDAETRGFHLNTLASPFCGWAEIVEKFLTAKEQLDKGDPEAMKTWVNTELGEPWEEPGSSLEDAELFNRREIYDAEVPDDVIVLTAGIDVQENRFEVEVVGWGVGKESWGIRYQKIYGDMLADLEATLETMDIGSLLGLFMQSILINVTMTALNIIIFVLVYGRMIEIYLLTSLAPIPVATLSNRELGGTGQNYLKSLFAVAFQGMLILVCVAIYAVLIQGIATSGDPIGAIWGTIGYTVLLCFMLFKTGGIAQRVFGAH